MNDNNRFFTETFLENNFLLENIQGGIVYSDFDPPFWLRYATEGMAKLSGYSTDELMNMVQMDLVHDDDIPALAADVEQQFSQGDTFEVDYRLKKKDGTYVYVLDRAKVVDHGDGKKYIHCLLTDISQLKEMEMALRLNEEKYKLAIQQSGNVIVEYDIDTNLLSFSENYRHIFGCSSPTGTLVDIVQSGWSTPEYQTPLINLFDEVIKTSTTCSIELLIKTDFERPIWCSLYLMPVVSNGRLYSIVGCLENIDEEKHKIDILTELSIKDSLTGIYNRYAVEKFVQEQIESIQSSETAVLAIIDIDYFKQVNDKNGHAYGDDVLVKLPQALTPLLPSKSIFGRLGGDEFLLFLTLPKKDSNLDQICENIVRGVKKSFENHITPITISLGAAWSTEQCKTFKELYRNADISLYETKRSGRDGYTVYNEK